MRERKESRITPSLFFFIFFLFLFFARTIRKTESLSNLEKTTERLVLGWESGMLRIIFWKKFEKHIRRLLDILVELSPIGNRNLEFRGEVSMSWMFTDGV